MNNRVLAPTRLFASSFLSFLLVFGSVSFHPAIAQTGERRVRRVEQVSQLPGSSKRWALIIGVNQYRDRQISALTGADNDAKALAEVLIERAGFPADQVIVLATDQPDERQPTRVNILRRLSNLRANVPKDGLLLFSFAGHGIDRGGRAFLLPSDAQISEDIEFLEDTALAVTRIRDSIKTIGVQQVLMLVDACRNDPGGRADAPNKLTDAYIRGFNFDVRNQEVTAFATLYATAVGERAFEYTEKQQGYFTWAIVEGLRGAAANEKGEVTLGNLVKYVQETVPKRIRIDFGSDRHQLPYVQVDGYKAEDLVVAMAEPASGGRGTSTGGPVDPSVIELSFWETIKNSSNPEEFKAYLKQYPEGRFAAIARIRSQGSIGNPGSLTGVTPSESVEPSDLAPAASRAVTHFRNGETLLNQQRFADAEAEYREAAKLDPNKATYHGWLGVALASQSKFAEAEARLKQAIKLDPKEAWFHYSLGATLAPQNRRREEEAEYREAIRLDPGNASYRYWLGACLGNQQRHAEAEAEFRRAIQIDPNQGLYHYSAGQARMLQQRYRDAEEDFKKALALDSSQPSYHWNLGCALFYQTRYVESEAAFRQAVRLNPYDASYHGWLGSALGNQRRPAEAEVEFREAVRLDASQAWHHSGLGAALFALSRYGEAEAAYSEAVRLNPSDAQSRAWLGSCLGNQQRHREAEIQFREAIRIDPNHVWFYTNLGYSLQAQGRIAEAEAAYRQALRLNPNDSAALEYLRRLPPRR